MILVVIKTPKRLVIVQSIQIIVGPLAISEVGQIIYDLTFSM